ncbi:MAG: YceD family protein [Polyangia bacterium]|jgi:uncharacterized protein
MRYKIKDIGEAGIDVRVEVTAAWLATACADISVGPSHVGVMLDGRLEPAGEGYLLRGQLQGELVVPCARCLDPAPVAVAAPMAISFLEKRDQREGRDLRNPADEGDDEQDDVVRFEHGVIDLGSPIRDEILLAIPMSAICRVDCAGICPSCGRNRNLTRCDCESRANEGSRFGTLAKVRLQ